MEKVLTDFYVKPYDDPRQEVVTFDALTPLHYFDNEDGFWDEYITQEQNKWAQNDMIVNRKFMKH